MQEYPLIITIDGPAGVGKTTVARQLAGAMGIAYLDTGAMFRAVGWLLSERDAANNETMISRLLSEVRFELEGKGWESFITMNKKRLGLEIRTEQVGMLASNAGRLEVVRSFLKKAQQTIGSTTSLVAEGRDMGSVVFKEARFKFFLDARPGVRAARRQAQLERMGIQTEYHTILDQIIKRDEQDTNRSIAPLKPAPDADIIDTGLLTPEEVFEEIWKNLQAGKSAAANSPFSAD